MTLKSKTPLLPFALRKYPLVFKALSDVVWTLAEACPNACADVLMRLGLSKHFKSLQTKNRKAYAVAVLIRST